MRRTDFYRTEKEEIDRGPARTLVADGGAYSSLNAALYELVLQELPSDVIILGARIQCIDVRAGGNEDPRIVVENSQGDTIVLNGSINGGTVETDPALPIPYKTAEKGEKLKIVVSRSADVTKAATYRYIITCARVQEPGPVPTP